jgi:hypothetical protein
MVAATVGSYMADTCVRVRVRVRARARARARARLAGAAGKCV